MCVRPGECRCRHGYFGANCDTSEYWQVPLCPQGVHQGGPGSSWGNFPEQIIRDGAVNTLALPLPVPWLCSQGIVPLPESPLRSSALGGGERGLWSRGAVGTGGLHWCLVVGLSPWAVLWLMALPTECPRQFWGPDCKEMCSCHPNGQCEDVTGQCTCNLNRWGTKCENICLCKHGKCDQKTGKCTCEPNWWGPQCSSSCYCSHNSQCDQQTGNCLCQPGWWGRGCNNQCSCNNSPCEQFTGRCQCRERTFGPRCDRYCQCYKGKCNQVDGTCTCEPGYRGKYCREPCPAGFYGQGCRRR